ncbi:MAG TPA: hypothetical protein VHO69_03950 [Phototrophicaceae bacterium]|nr:hypothetical protein [Phototrophicaceae bacterium]
MPHFCPNHCSNAQHKSDVQGIIAGGGSIMRHSYLFLTLICLLFALPTLSLTAQDTPTAWPVETHCVGEPTTPPEDWTFPGAILMTGNFGIHAVHAGWDTPHVVAFLEKNNTTNTAGLSPNGLWYAVMLGGVRPSAYNNQVVQVDETGIIVYSTLNPREKYSVNWDNTYGYVGMQALKPNFLWLDNEHLVYTNALQGEGISAAIINPFSGESDLQYTNCVQWTVAYLQPSPDWSSFIYDASFKGNEWTLTSGDITQTLTPEGSPYMRVIWKPDSSAFVAQNIKYGVDYGEPIFSDLALYNDKRQIDSAISKNTSILDNSEASVRIDWSPNGRYLAYIAGDKKELHLADTQTKTVRNLCVSTDSLSWSPDGKQLALLKMGDYKQRQQPVLVFDLASDQLHTVAYHSGSIIGWRED